MAQGIENYIQQAYTHLQEYMFTTLKEGGSKVKQTYFFPEHSDVVHSCIQHVMKQQNLPHEIMKQIIQFHKIYNRIKLRSHFGHFLYLILDIKKKTDHVVSITGGTHPCTRCRDLSYIAIDQIKTGNFSLLGDCILSDMTGKRLPTMCHCYLHSS